VSLAKEYKCKGDVQTFELYIYTYLTDVSCRSTSKNKEFGGAMHPETFNQPQWIGRRAPTWYNQHDPSSFWRLYTLKRSISLNGLDGGECLHSATPRQPTGFLILLAGLCTLKRSINLNGFEGGECLHSKATRQPTRSLHPFSVIPFPGHVLRFRLAVGRVRNLAPQWLFMSHSYLITNLSSPLSVNTYAPPQL